MTLSTPILYLSTVFIWGTTFYAIRFQLGDVSPVVSVMWRFLLAATVLFVWIVLKRLSCRFSVRQHVWIFLQGLTLFSFNYVLVYTVTADLTSGLVAVVFAGVVGMNILNGALFLRRPISLPVVFGASLGCVGLALVFWPEVRAASTDAGIHVSIGIALLATYLASIGNIISARNQAEQMPLLQSNAFGMLYGAGATMAYLRFAGIPLDFSSEPTYLLSLLYLSIFGSVLAFGAYLSLVGQVGADRAAYAMVLFPLVALGISTLFEGYHWPVEAVFGVALVIFGNLLMLDKRLWHKLHSMINPKLSAPTTPES